MNRLQTYRDQIEQVFAVIDLKTNPGQTIDQALKLIADQALIDLVAQKKPYELKTLADQLADKNLNQDKMQLIIAQHFSPEEIDKAFSAAAKRWLSLYFNTIKPTLDSNQKIKIQALINS